MPQEKAVTEVSPVTESVKKPDAPVTAPVAEDRHPKVSAEDFCRGISATDKRVEMIGAFYGEEIRYGRQFDEPANFAARLEAFAVRPVPFKG